MNQEDKSEGNNSLYYDEVEQKEEIKVETKDCDSCQLQEIEISETICKGCDEGATKEEVENMLI